MDIKMIEQNGKLLCMRRFEVGSDDGGRGMPSEGLCSGGTVSEYLLRGKVYVVYRFDSGFWQVEEGDVEQGN